jgi:predicted SAM-dependent methyltransferase
MPVETVDYQGISYPAFQTTGNAARFIQPLALEFCKGVGYDIGYCKPEWKLPGAIGVDLADGKGYSADKLPEGNVDYIFSSHCLEHVDNWVDTLLYWHSCVKPGGVIFLYLPDYSQTYWRPWNNRKHRHVMDPTVIKGLLESKGCKNIFVSGVDLNNSFSVVCEVV